MLNFMVFSANLPLQFVLPSFCITERKLQCNRKKIMDPTPGTVGHTQVTGLPLLTALKQCRKKEYSILTSLLFISNCWLWAPTVWSSWFLMGRDTILEAQAYRVLSSASLGIKAIFLFSPKNIYFHKDIRFLYSCSFLHCFKTIG